MGNDSESEALRATVQRGSSTATIDKTFDAKPEDLFGKELGQQLISMLLNHDLILNDQWQNDAIALLPSLAAGYFIVLAHQFVMTIIHKLYDEIGVIPNPDAAWYEASKILTVNDDYEPVKDAIYAKPNPRFTALAIRDLKSWIKKRKMLELFDSESIQLIEQGNYDHVTRIVAEAAAIEQTTATPFDMQTVLDFLNRPKERTWLVDNVLVAGQPTLIAGPKKAMKTAIAVDLFLSLVTGGKFLGEFQVPEPKKVFFFSCESGEDDIDSRLRAIAAAKRIDVSKLDNAHISFRRPRLSDGSHLTLIGNIIKEHQLDAFMVDPLYLTLLTGNSEISAANLFQMGGVFAGIAEICLPSNCTPILTHHFRKNQKDDLDLDQMSFVGSAEFCRQSILVARTAAYTNPANNRLRLRLHGHNRGALYRVTIDEGTVDTPAWRVTLESESEAAGREQRIEQDRREVELCQLLLEDVESVLAGGKEATAKAIREQRRCWRDPDVLEQTVEQAVSMGWIERYDTIISGQQCQGMRVKAKESTDQLFGGEQEDEQNQQDDQEGQEDGEQEGQQDDEQDQKDHEQN